MRNARIIPKCWLQIAEDRSLLSHKRLLCSEMLADSLAIRVHCVLLDWLKKLRALEFVMVSQKILNGQTASSSTEKKQKTLL